MDDVSVLEILFSIVVDNVLLLAKVLSCMQIKEVSRMCNAQWIKKKLKDERRKKKRKKRKKKKKEKKIVNETTLN